MEDSVLYEKFKVTRNDGKSAPGQRHYRCRYFVLDLDHDSAAPEALFAYADKCETDRPTLASRVRLLATHLVAAQAGKIVPRIERFFEGPIADEVPHD